MFSIKGMWFHPDVEELCVGKVVDTRFATFVRNHLAVCKECRELAGAISPTVIVGPTSSTLRELTVSGGGGYYRATASGIRNAIGEGTTADDAVANLVAKVREYYIELLTTEQPTGGHVRLDQEFAQAHGANWLDGFGTNVVLR